jgi:hypothetical protein
LDTEATAEEESRPGNIQEISVNDAALRKFESQVIDDRGCFIYFDKIVPVEEENEAEKAGGKKPPAKAPAKKQAKDAVVEEAKPTHCRGWFDLTPLMHPGTKSVTQRVFINLCSKEEAQYPKKIDETTIDPVLVTAS